MSAIIGESYIYQQQLKIMYSMFALFCIRMPTYLIIVINAKPKIKQDIHY